MNGKIHHLLLGVFLFVLYVLLASMEMPLMRLSDALAPSQTLAIIASSESISVIPFVGVIKRNWNIKKPMEWIAFCLTGFLMACNYLGQIFCAQHMPLGDSASLDIGSGTMLIPVFTWIFYRRCTSLEDLTGFVWALVGVVLITQPTFLFGMNQTSKSIPAYVLAFMSGVPNSLSLFVIGYYPHIHWSTYIVIRTGFTASLSVLLLPMTGHWKRNSDVLHDAHALHDAHVLHDADALWVSVMSAFVLGVITNVYRVTSVFGCHELEKHGASTAGIVGNIVCMGLIAVTAIYAFLFFDEVMTNSTLIGAALIVFAIILLTGVRILRLVSGKEGEEGEEGEEKQLIVASETAPKIAEE